MASPEKKQVNVTQEGAICDVERRRKSDKDVYYVEYIIEYSSVKVCVKLKILTA